MRKTKLLMSTVQAFCFNAKSKRASFSRVLFASLSICSNRPSSSRMSVCALSSAGDDKPCVSKLARRVSCSRSWLELLSMCSMRASMSCTPATVFSKCPRRASKSCMSTHLFSRCPSRTATSRSWEAASGLSFSKRSIRAPMSRTTTRVSSTRPSTRSVWSLVAFSKRSARARLSSRRSSTRSVCPLTSSIRSLTISKSPLTCTKMSDSMLQTSAPPWGAAAKHGWHKS
mmetsp:Transcript_102074/g.293927  ORF Transcript_102074/g.293927 Transcript_102074/m.293927 type:complete len:229 (-) Transcript_102074:626-1312(-)